MRAEKPAPNGASFSDMSIETRQPNARRIQVLVQDEITEETDRAPLPITLHALHEGAGEHQATLKDALIGASELISRDLPPRPKVLGDWLKEGDFGFIFAPRGHGKTWLTMLIGNAIAGGHALGEWQAGDSSRRLIYFDAEMNLPDVQERSRLIGIQSEYFNWLQNELIYEKLKRGLNIAEPSDQESISELLEEGDVFIIDNLSTASSGMAENDNDAFDALKDWILTLRSRKITVIIVHHAGRNGQMRGASRREDMAHWILSLKDHSSDAGVKSWITNFQKCRNCKPTDAPSLLWTISTANEHLTYTCKPHSGPDAMFALIQEGIDKASELAEELNVTSGCVSKWAKKLAKEGLIKIEGRKYLPA